MLILVVLYVANMAKPFSNIIHSESLVKRTGIIISNFLNLGKVFFIKSELLDSNYREKMILPIPLDVDCRIHPGHFISLSPKTIFAHIKKWYKETDFSRKNSVSLSCSALSFIVDLRINETLQPGAVRNRAYRRAQVSIYF